MCDQDMTTRVATIGAICILTIALSSCGSATPEEAYAQYVASAESYFERRDFPNALIEYKNAAREQPESAAAYYGMGKTLLRMESAAAGVQALEQAVRLDPHHTEATLLLSRLLVRAGDTDYLADAERMLGAVLVDDEGDPEARLLLATIRARQADGPESMSAVEEILRDSLEYTPDHLRSAIFLSRLRLMEKDPDGAEQALLEVVETTSEKAPARTALGELYRRLGRPEEATKQFTLAQAEDETFVPARLGRGLMQLRSGEKEAAEETIRQAANLATSPKIRLSYGYVLAAHGKLDEASAEFERRSAEDPEDQSARMALVTSHYRAGRFDEAIGVLTARIEQKPDDIGALVARASLYGQARYFDKAIGDLRLAKEKRPTSIEARYLLSKIHLAAGDRPLQQTELEALLDLNHFHLPARLDLASNRIDSGSPGAAVELLELAPPTQRESPALRGRMISAHLAAKNLPAARQEIDAALSARRTAEIVFLDGMVRRLEGDKAGAMASFTEALELNPAHLRSVRALAVSYVESGQPAEGVAWLKRHTEAHPRQSQLQSAAGVLFFRARRPGLARQALERAVDANPRNMAASLSLADLEVANGNFEAARTAIDDVLSLNPRAPRALTSRAQIQSHSANLAHKEFEKAVRDNEGDGDTPLNAELNREGGTVDSFQAAIDRAHASDPSSRGNLSLKAALDRWRALLDATCKDYEDVLAVNPDSVVALNNLAYLTATHYGRLDEGLEYAQRAKAIAPNSYAIDDTLGWIYCLKGIYESALAHLKMAVEKAPAVASIHYHLSIAHAKTDNVTEAVAAYETGLSLDSNADGVSPARKALGL